MAVFNQSHTGENIQEIEDMLQNKLDINLQSWPLFATSDNASNMVKGQGLSMLMMYGCVNILGIGTAQALGIFSSFSHSFFSPSYFSPERGCHSVLKFCMGL